MNQRESVNRAAVARWRRRALGREIVEQFDEQLRKATEDRLPPEDDFDAVPDAPTPADTAAAPPKIHKEKRKSKTHKPGKRTTLEEDWRRDARALGVAPQQVHKSWLWYYRCAVEAPPVLEEREQRKARETMPGSVRRVLTRHPVYRFVGYDAEVLDDLEPIPDDVRTDADARQFWEDVRDAQKNDTPKSAARLALGRFGRSIKLNSELMRRLARMHGTNVAAEKRRLIQEAVVLSLQAAEKPIRIGEQKTKHDPGHPIRLEEIFGPEGLRDILPYVKRDRLEDALRERLKASLGGPFHPARLTDRVVYRNWLTKEIQRRTVELLEEDLDLRDAGRIGGSRREDISYNETELLPETWHGEIGPDTHAFTDSQMRATGEREERERGARTTSRFMKRHDAWVTTRRLEDAILNRIDVQRRLERIQQDNENAPQRLQYLDCIRREPRLFLDNATAAKFLGWDEKTVRDTKHLLVKRARGRWKSSFTNRL
jgi:hypothetical protein